ncbi:helix-turn-helix domain-containing protein [Leifsonia poae]|uniref:helix-turn-helix domain-containing protein n=1 Tax=Leifsonia poae TaxID=110933 RepID=UPI003D663DA6
MFEGLPVEVRALLKPDGSVIVPPAVVPWLELQLREQLKKARGNPSSPAVALLKAFTVAAERFESAGQSSFSGTTERPAGRIDVSGVEGSFLTSAQAAELTERSERGIRKACERQKLPAQKVGNLWHIAPKDLDNYIYRRVRPMATKKDELVPVTAEDVAQAWTDVENAKTAAAELRTRVVNGDDTITQSDIASQQGVVEWLELVAHRTENQRERYEEAYAIRARKDLKAEILASQVGDSQQLLQSLNSLFAYVRSIETLGAEHDARYKDWGNRLRALGVPELGVVSEDHDGMGMESGGSAILIDSVRLAPVNAPNLLRLIFDVGETGIAMTKDESRLRMAIEIVEPVGKAVA